MWMDCETWLIKGRPFWKTEVENNDNSYGFVCQRNVTLALLDLDQTFMFGHKYLLESNESSCGLFFNLLATT